MREVVLTIHWRGGRHSELRVRKPRAGDHGCATTKDALAVMRSMAGHWLDEHVAASLNRMGMPTGQGKTWTAHRVAWVRRVRGIHTDRSAEKDGARLTMTGDAKAGGVTNHRIRRLIGTGVLPAKQVVRGALSQFVPLTSTRRRFKPGQPATVARVASPMKTRFQCLLIVDERVHNDPAVAIGLIWFSTGLVSGSRGPSLRKRIRPGQCARV